MSVACYQSCCICREYEDCKERERRSKEKWTYEQQRKSDIHRLEKTEFTGYY